MRRNTKLPEVYVRGRANRVQASLLIIDSIANNRVALKVSLTAAWYDVSVAATGADALAQIDAFRPDLMLVNCRLTDMQLSEFCARVKAMCGKDTPPILALTTTADDREPLLRCGVEDVLQVPADDTLLIARIRSILRAHANVAEWRLRDGTSRALGFCLLYTSPSPRDLSTSRMPSSA